MRKFFDSKFAFAAVLTLFTSAFAWNIAHGAVAIDSGHPTFPPMAWLINSIAMPLASVYGALSLKLLKTPPSLDNDAV